MSADTILWYAARVAAMAAFFVLSLSLFTGMAIRTAYLSSVAKNRVVIGLHSFLAWFWIPLIAVHIGALLLDTTAGIGVLDVIVPFQSHIRGQPGGVGASVAIGLGTVGLLLIVLVGISAGFRGRMSPGLWNWIHRLSYPMFVIFLFHAQFAGTDFTHVTVSVVGWATLGALALLAIPRLRGARMAAPPTIDSAATDGAGG